MNARCSRCSWENELLTEGAVCRRCGAPLQSPPAALAQQRRAAASATSNGKAFLGTVPEEIEFDEVTTRFDEVTTRFDPNPHLFDDVTKQFNAVSELGGDESALQSSAYAWTGAPPPMIGAPARTPSRVSMPTQSHSLPQSLPPSRPSAAARPSLPSFANDAFAAPTNRTVESGSRARSGLRNDSAPHEWLDTERVIQVPGGANSGTAGRVRPMAAGPKCGPEPSQRVSTNRGGADDLVSRNANSGASTGSASAPSSASGHDPTWGFELVSPRVSSLAPTAGASAAMPQPPSNDWGGLSPSEIQDAHMRAGQPPTAPSHAAPPVSLRPSSAGPAASSYVPPTGPTMAQPSMPGSGAASLRPMVQDEAAIPPGWPRSRRRAPGKSPRVLVWTGVAAVLAGVGLWLVPRIGGESKPSPPAAPIGSTSSESIGARADLGATQEPVPAAELPRADTALAHGVAAPTTIAPSGTHGGAGEAVASSSAAPAVGAGAGLPVASARVASARRSGDVAPHPAQPAVPSARSASAPSTAKTSKSQDESEEDNAAPESTIDVAAAQQALDEATAAALQCKSEDGPRGVARVVVSFAPSGRAAAVSVVGSGFVGALEGECIAAKFRAIHVPEFTGDRVTMYRSVKIQ